MFCGGLFPGRSIEQTLRHLLNHCCSVDSAVAVAVAGTVSVTMTVTVADPVSLTTADANATAIATDSIRLLFHATMGTLILKMSLKGYCTIKALKNFLLAP